uniref:Uncharacterized protein n=1 Tax=Rhizophora mucronata TaxID=61149 RepID=A0A2P2R0S9_RHIMU
MLLSVFAVDLPFSVPSNCHLINYSTPQLS